MDEAEQLSEEHLLKCHSCKKPSLPPPTADGQFLSLVGIGFYSSAVHAPCIPIDLCLSMSDSDDL